MAARPGGKLGRQPGKTAMKIIICGAGQVGTTIARHLAHEGNDVTVIDASHEAARRADESHDIRGMVGFASHPATLREAGAKDADLLIAVTRSDEVNMVACQVAHSLFKVKRRIARLRHHGYLESIGSGLYADDQMPVDVIISPEVEVAAGIARRLRTPGAFDMVTLAGGRLQLLGIQCESAACAPVGSTIATLRQQASKHGFVAVALSRQGTTFVPRPEDRIEAGDGVYVVTPPDQIEQVLAAFGHRERLARRIVIVGGGNIGLQLAMTLSQENLISLKVIEHSPARAEMVAQTLGASVVVLQGDALEREMLEEANTGAADTLVAVTNDDETNIFTSVLARRAGCARVITLVNKSSYAPVVGSLGIDTVVSPSSITISSILRHVRKGAIAQVYQLPGDETEVVEARALAGSRLVSGPLGSLGLPAGMVIGAVIRGEEIITPDATTQLQPGDSVVAAVASTALKQAEALLALPDADAHA
jgi:trk system potassium uptake protein TrkA